MIEKRNLARRVIALAIGIVASCGFFCQPAAGASADRAKAIVGAAGRSDGLCVIVGEADAELAVAMSEKGNFLIHCLFADAPQLDAARKALAAKGLYGKISADLLPPGRLPYADGTVNLIVAERSAPPREELLRALCPNGAAWLGAGKKLVKPRPPALGDWTHFLHGPSGNAVAKDTAVGPPKHMQWIDGPTWQRHHEKTQTVSAMVSAGGRLFTIVDDAPAGVFGPAGKWSLTARDAYNGMVLWRRPMTEWGWRQWSATEMGRFNQPVQLPRRLVAAGGKVFVTMGFNAPVTALDQVTGRTVRTYPQTQNASEIVYKEGVLYVAVNREAQKPGLIKDLPPTKKDVLAIEAATGKLLWRSGPFVGIASKMDSIQRITHVNLIVGDTGLYLLDDTEVVGLSVTDGKELWRTPRPEWNKSAKTLFSYNMPNLCTIVCGGGRVFLAQPREVRAMAWNDPAATSLQAMDAATGRVLWTRECGTWGRYNGTDVFLIDSLVWVHSPPKEYAMLGLDPATGEVSRKIDTAKALNHQHHHRCYRNKATERFFVTSRRGVEFTDVRSGDITIHPWTRGVCRFGVVPCNGLLYAPPHPCICYITAKLNGLYALAPQRPAAPKPASSPLLEKGPAYGAANPQSAIQNPQSNDWPTYRGDPRRSGSTKAEVGGDLTKCWEAALGGRPSSPVAAEGKVFVAVTDRHRVAALDAATGRELWSYTVGGRVDSPPTIHAGLALFGSADGWAYCLSAADGKLVWRLRAGPEDMRLIDHGQLASAWPVHGSVLVTGGVAYFAAGRSSFLDGGMYVCAIEPATGKVVGRMRIASGEPGVRARYDMPLGQPGALPDILITDGADVFMRHLKFPGGDLNEPWQDTRPTPPTHYPGAGGTPKASAAKRKPKPKGPDPAAKPAPAPKPDLPPVGLRLYAEAGLLDDSWFNQSFWSLGGRFKCHYLVFDDTRVVGLSIHGSTKRHNRSHYTAGQNYKLFMRHLAGEAAGQWEMAIPVRVKAMVLAGGTILAAGVPAEVDPKDPWASFDGKKGSLLWAISTASPPTKLAEHKLPDAVVPDGIAVTPGRVYVSTQDGTLHCFAGAK